MKSINQADRLKSMIRKFRGKEAGLKRERPKSAQDINELGTGIRYLYKRNFLLVTTTAFNPYPNKKTKLT